MGQQASSRRQQQPEQSQVNVHGEREPQNVTTEKKGESQGSRKITIPPESLSHRGCDFVGSLLTGTSIRSHPVALPVCWDELLDWCHEVTTLSSLLSIESPSLPSKLNGTKAPNIGPSSSLSHHEASNLVFKPWILRDEKESLLNLPNLSSWMDRALFYSQTVVISIQEADRDEIFSLLTVATFSELYSLLCRLDDLVRIQQWQTVQARNEPSSPSACLICASDDTEACVLSCTHSLCVDCERRWVRRHLQCPFCRQGVSRRQTDAWVLTTWSESEVDQDVGLLQSRVAALWTTVVDRGDGESGKVGNWSSFLQAYSQAPRTIGMEENANRNDVSLDDEDGFVLISCDSSIPAT